MELALLLVGVIAGIFGINFLKNKQAGAVLAQNNKVKDELAEKDKQLGGVRDSLKIEEEMRNQLKEDVNKEKDETPTPDNLLDFFNKRK